ncbi:MAG TPA: hypothetical protein VGK67_12145 [Myxococcales bacterium]|jgi:hypothetical protein
MLPCAALLAFVLAAPPPVAKAEELAAKNDAEGLFLQFGAVKADDYPAEEKARLAKALTKGVEASRKDPAIAVGLAEKAVLLDKTAESLTLLGEVEVDLQQRAAAAGHFDEALALEADHVPALMGRGDLAMKEDDFAVAVDRYERAQKAGAKNARLPLEKAKKGLEAKSKAVEDLKKTEQAIKVRVADAARNATRDWLKQIAADDEEAYQKKRLAPDGVRRQQIANFVFTYSAGDAKTSDMFAFESKVEKLLEKTYDFVSDLLGYKRSVRTNVVLMTRAEFARRHAGTPQVRAAGYWNGHEIVINGGSSIDERFVQVMIHEFTHVVVADLAGHGVPPRWFNEGLAENARLSAIGLKGKVEDQDRQMLAFLKKQGKLPSVGQLDAAFVQLSAGAEIAYSLAALATSILIEKRGYSQYLDTLREMKRSNPMQVFERDYMSVAELDKMIGDSL